MAQQRLNALDQNATLLGSTVGLGKEGKKKLASIEAERQAILKAFPQLGKAQEGGNGQESGNPEEFDIKKWLAAKDYSPEAIRRLYEENDRDAWDEAIRTGDLKLFNAMNDFRLGSLSDDTKNKMRYVISQRPDLSKELKLNKEYSGLLDLIPSTQGDIIDAEKKRERDEANAKIQNDIRKATDIARALLSDNATGEEWDMLKEDEKENLKRHINDIPADIRSNAISFMRAMNLIP